jgi:hypothetical protein
MQAIDCLLALSGLAKVFGDRIGCAEYFVGLWKPDMVRGLMWDAAGPSRLRRYGDSQQAGLYPTWSWASAGYEGVTWNIRNQNKAPLSQVADVQVNVVHECQPFGAIKSRSVHTVTLTGPFKRLARLYNSAWSSADAPMSELERHLSRVVESESSGDTRQRDWSPSFFGAHFAVLLMLGDKLALDLLILEAAGQDSTTTVYRRVGVFTLRRTCRAQADFPDMPDEYGKIIRRRLRRMKAYLNARFGPLQEDRDEGEFCGEVIAEIKREDWEKQTVTII